VRASLVQSLGDPHAVRVLDETGFLTQGQQWVGVARQDRGPAGRGEHCQRGVLLAYASGPGHAWLDRALSLPHVWTDDRARCQHAGGPAEQRCAPKPQLARHRLQRAFEARGPAPWVTGESVYGDDRRRRVGWAEQDHA
jgi:SRSO17 transposase